MTVNTRRRRIFIILIFISLLFCLILYCVHIGQGREQNTQNIHGRLYQSGSSALDFRQATCVFTAGFHDKFSEENKYWKPYRVRGAVAVSFQCANHSNDKESAYEMFGELTVKQGEEQLFSPDYAYRFEPDDDYLEYGVGHDERKKSYTLCFLLKDTKTPIEISIREPGTKKKISMGKIEISAEDEKRIAEKCHAFEATAKQQEKQDKDRKYIEGGIYRAGSEIKAGEYLVLGEYDQVAPYILNPYVKDMEVAPGMAKRAYIKVKEGEYLRFSGKAVLAEQASAYDGDIYRTGMYKVGKDIAPGTYTVTAQEGGSVSKVEVFSDVQAAHYEQAGKTRYFEAHKEQAVTLQAGEYVRLVDCTMDLAN